MAKTVKSVLMIDFDSVRRSLDRIDPIAGAGFAERAGDWLEAFEKGDLITPRQPRRILVRRCFADPDLLEDGSADLAAAGFDIVECPPRSGGRSSAEVHLAIDAVDALGSDTEYEEFIILSGDSDLAPLLMRLKGDNRATAIYSDAGTKPGQDQLADAILPAELLAEFIAGDDTEGQETVSRDKIEAFARRICAATSVPLLSPRSYGELFRQLAHEITTSGYSFQTTAKNVADRLSESGRNVARRQVVFVVKGLALKGHVFSKDDTAEMLASVFLEQVRYLTKSAGIKLDGREERLLNAWLVQRSKATRKATSRKAKADGAKSAGSGKRDRKVKSKAKPPRPTGKKKPSRAATPPPPVEPVATKPATATEPPATPEADAQPTDDNQGENARKGRTADEIKAEIAARISRSLREKKAARSKGPKEAAAPPARAAARPRPRAEPPPEDEAETPAAPPLDSEPAPAAGAPLESSILAAIAEAVDVLVEGDAEPAPTTAPPRQEETETAPAVAPEPRAEEGEESDDIGDEIQRIIASYQRDRDPEDR